MQFTCSQSDLNQHLSIVSRVVPSRPSHPILANVLVKADPAKGLVSITGFDLSIGIKTEFQAEVIEGGEVTLPARLLNDIVSKLSEGDITLKQTDNELDRESVNLIYNSGEFQIRGLNASQYPAFPDLIEANPLVLPIAALSEGLKGVLFAASNEDTKQILTGVHLKENREQLEFAATDSHRLAVVESFLDKTDNDNLELSVTIPAKALRELERIISTRNEEETIILYVGQGQIAFDCGKQRLVSRKLEGNYPAYSQLIPKTFKRTVAIDRKSLVSKLELVSVLADQKNHLVKFTIDGRKSEVALSVDAQELGSAKEIISADVTGENGEIAFNVKYLLDGLKALPSNDILMQLNDPNQPVIFSPLGGVKMTYLVMPVQIIR